MEWILETTRLPDEDQEVLLTDGEFMSMGWRFKNYWHSYDKLYPVDDTTHWMPLPELPV